QAQSLLVVAEEVVQLGELEQDVRLQADQLRLWRCELGCAFEMDDRFGIGEELPRAPTCTYEVVDRLRTGFAEIQMARQEIEHLIAGAVQLLRRLGHATVKVA